MVLSRFDWWGFLLFIIGILIIVGGIKSIIYQEAIYTKRSYLFRREEIIRTGLAAVVSGIAHIVSGLLLLFWASIEFSNMVVAPICFVGLIALVWLTQTIGIGIGEFIARKSQTIP